MKNVKVFILTIALALLVSSTAMANTTTETTSKNQLRTELIELLGNYEKAIEKENLTARVSFIVNDNNELIVLSVESENGYIDKYVKSKLNYKKVVASGISKNEIYVMPLKIEKPS